MKLVRITYNDDGDKIEKPTWCMVQDHADAERTVCGGEVFGLGEGIAKYTTKPYSKHGITCNRCKEIIKWFKSIPL